LTVWIGLVSINAQNIKEIEIEPELELSQIKDLVFYDYLKVDSISGLELIDVDVIPCDSIKDFKVLPSKYHKDLIETRLLFNEEVKNTLIVAFITKSDCCAKFFVDFACLSEKELNIEYQDISEEQCFCGGCPYIFTVELEIHGVIPRKIFVNNQRMEFSDKIYKDQIDVVKKNKITGKETISTYSGTLDNVNLLLEQTFNRKGELIEFNTFYLGFNTKNIK
jgi:hypothetical protein